ncbi:MAG: hypothetical protein K2K32_04585 [Muribaculaceae bacterium]|nr:hypothetical protein [Muribaculaceae bacterium]
MNKTIIPGKPATVSALANATGGIDAGNFVEPDIDQQLFRFNSDDTPLMNLMLRAKRVKVSSPEVDHYMIDEPKSTLTTTSNFVGGKAQEVLQLQPGEENLPREYTTLLVKGVDGYEPDGKTRTPGKSLMLFVVGHDAATGGPIVRAVNGVKYSPDDEVSLLPPIPEGTKLVMLANSLHETQKQVDPDLIVPQPTRIFLQKRGMNQVVSDYFESQKMRVPFAKAVVAEQAIANFKVRGNRTLWAGRAGKFRINVPQLGMQTIYTTEGLRWQFKRELQHSGRWTVEKIIALAKMFFTGEDVPKTALLLAGKDLLEQIQCVDYSRHPEIQISTKVNSIGWTVTNFHTVFGDIEIKREPTLDRLGWSHSGALIGEDRLVHYVYSAEHHFQDRMEGHEATRSGILIWDALALKGSCHIWIDGEGEAANAGGELFELWQSETAPEEKTGTIFYLVSDCPGISKSAKSGTMWTYDGTSWKEHSGELQIN